MTALVCYSSCFRLSAWVFLWLMCSRSAAPGCVYQAFSLSFAHNWLSPTDKFPRDLIFWIPIVGRCHPCSSGTDSWLPFAYFFFKVVRRGDRCAFALRG